MPQTDRFAGNNQLQSLPAAIGGLVHLKELNISNNRIVCLYELRLSDVFRNIYLQPS